MYIKEQHIVIKSVGGAKSRRIQLKHFNDHVDTKNIFPINTRINLRETYRMMSKKKFREIEFWIILEEFFLEGKRGRGKFTSLLFTNQENFF